MDTHSTDIPVEHEPANINYNSLITAAFLLLGIGRNMINVAAILHGLAQVAAPGRLENHYFPRGVFVEELVVMPPSTLGFMITVLLAFADIKSQGNPEFPFETHPYAIMISVTSLIMYGLVSAAEIVVPGARNHNRNRNPSVYVIIARFARIGCLCILVVALSSLFYI